MCHQLRLGGYLTVLVSSLCLLTRGLSAQEIQAKEPATPDNPQFTLEQLATMEVPSVQAASKYSQKITEAPSSVTIITSDEVQKQGYRTLAEILRSVPGMYTVYDRAYSFLGVRGFNLGDNNNRVLLLVDGHRVNNSLTDSAFIGTEFILDVDLIDHVEIVRGPGSSLYGNNAFFGVINVVTRRGRDMPGYGAEASAEYGSFDSYKGRVTYGNKVKGVEFLLSGTIYGSQGDDALYYPEFDTPQNNNGVAKNADNEQFGSFFGKVAYLDFTLEGAFHTREKRNPTAQYLTDFNDNRFRTEDDRSFVSLRFEHSFEEVVDVDAQFYYDRYDNDIYEPYEGTLYADRQVGQWWGTEVQFTRRFWDRHVITFGGEYRQDFDQHRETSGGVSQSDWRQNYGIYLQGDFQVITNLHLNAGLRYDQYGDLDPAFNPRVALIYNPVGQAVFKAVYGTAFRAPNFFELQLHNYAGVPAPDPERITTYQLIYEQGIGSHLRSSVTGFYSKIKDLITVDSSGGISNVEGADARGVELALDATLLWGLKARAGYTYQQTEDSSTGEQLVNSPQNLANFILTVPLYEKKLFAGLELLYVGASQTTYITPDGLTHPGTEAGGYTLLNLTLFSRELLKGVEFSASVYNVLNLHYYHPSTPYHQQDQIAQDGTTFRVKLTYNF